MITLNFAWLAVTYGMFYAGAAGLSCHCDETNCGKNRYCNARCKRGFYGPGCLTRNVAFNKSARLSSSMRYSSASLAVDEQFALPTDPTALCFCSQNDGFSENMTVNWWQVILSPHEKYYIHNVTIVTANNNPTTVLYLRNFVIYLSNDTRTYPNGTWEVCASQTEAADYYSTYFCTNTKIARSVTIVRYKDVRSWLTLCEVFIGGYVYKECKTGFGGPGCLLRQCDYSSCYRHNGICNEFGGCEFTTCPGKARLPPYCLLTLPDMSDYLWTTESTLSVFKATGRPLGLATDLRATSIALEMYSSGREINYTGKFTYSIHGNGSVSFEIEQGRYKLYTIRVTPNFCFSEDVCGNRSTRKCTEKAKTICYEGLKSKPLAASWNPERLTILSASLGFSAFAILLVVIFLVRKSLCQPMDLVLTDSTVETLTTKSRVEPNVDVSSKRYSQTQLTKARREDAWTRTRSQSLDYNQSEVGSRTDQGKNVRAKSLLRPSNLNQTIADLEGHREEYFEQKTAPGLRSSKSKSDYSVFLGGMDGRSFDHYYDN